MFGNYLSKSIILLAIVIFGITAWNSHGFHHFDEHYQIIEFAGLKLGFNEARDLPWEFSDQIRTTVQPWLALGYLNVVDALGVSHPNTQMQILRFLSGSFILLCLLYYFKQWEGYYSGEWKLVFLFTAILSFYVPYIAVRFSSESWGAGFFLLGMSRTITLNDRKNSEVLQWLAVGALLGVSFLFRLQMCFAIFGLGLWLIIFQSNIKSQLFGIILGGGLILLFGFILDYLFYDNWVFSPWNYFKANILEHKAASFGVSPWHMYITKLFKYKALSVLTGTQLILVLLYVIRKPKSLFTFIFIPFVLAHLFVGHKEMRFLYPIFLILPIAIVDSISWIKDLYKAKWFKFSWYSFLAYLLLINFCALFAYMIKPAEKRVVFYDHLINECSDQPIYHLEAEYDFFDLNGPIAMKYYRKELGELKSITPNGIKKLKSGDVVLIEGEQEIEGLDQFERIEVFNPLLMSINQKDWMRFGYCPWTLYKKRE